MHSLELSVLDLGTRSSQSSGMECLRQSLALVQLSESLGYSRYWIAEHHEANSTYGAPDVFLGWLASHTKRIKLGSAGVLLRYHDPYLVAQSFTLLNALYPGRIEVGVARGSIGGELKDYFSRFDVSAEALSQKCTELARLIHTNSQFSILRPHNSRPALWMMGGEGAMMAASANKMSFCLDIFYQILSDDKIQEILAEYVRRFQARSLVAMPEYSVAISGICAETTVRAQQWLDESPATGFPTGTVKPVLAGSPEQWRTYLWDVSEKWKTRKFVFLVSSLDLEVRRTSLRLLADALEFPRRETITGTTTELSTALGLQASSP